MKKSQIAELLILVGTVFASPLLCGQNVNVTTWHNDNWRDGQNTSETLLTPTTVNKTGFGKICSYAVDGQIYAQPLVLTGLAIGGGHPVVYVVTMNDTIYAFDGTNCNSLITPLHLAQSPETAVNCAHTVDNCVTIKPSIGILGTPVIDTSSQTLFVVTERPPGQLLSTASML